MFVKRGKKHKQIEAIELNLITLIMRMSRGNRIRKGEVRQNIIINTTSKDGVK